MFRSRSWFGGGMWKPKNPHSLETLKYLYNVLSKNQTVSESNRGLLVESLRSIAEILIWGDQNDSSVFDFFLEKNMLSFFLNILKQRCGSYVCVQLLQTLNILFENIRNETSLYYLLSNNHVNSIIVHKFDFSDEEVMAYYISFLKTLSLKLNSHTIHFFYNEHTNDFPLYTEAIKFFNHPESMVRIAVRTLSLNVYRVDDKSMLQFIRNKTAAPYFSNLVWFIGNHVLELDSCVRNEANHNNENRLADLVAEHLDHLHYLNDILTLNIEALNQVLTHHLLNKLLIPLYIYSLISSRTKLSSSSSDSQGEDSSSPVQRSRISSVVSLFLLSQVFLILSHEPLLHTLAHIILKGSANIYKIRSSENGHIAQITKNKIPGFVPPSKTLEESLDTDRGGASSSGSPGIDTDEPGSHSMEAEEYDLDLNITDEEKEQRLAQNGDGTPGIFLETIVSTLVCFENDYTALFSLCLLYAIAINKGVGTELTQSILAPATDSASDKPSYNSSLVDKLIDIVTLSCQPGCRVRLVTLEVTILLLKKLVVRDQTSILSDAHLAAIVNAKEESTSLLRNFYKSEDIFLDMFQFEYDQIQKKPLNVEYLMMDSKMLLPPAGTPLTGIDFTKRLACGGVERAKRAIRVFLHIRELCLLLAGEQETQLPLTDYRSCVQVDSVLDLTNSDLIGCHVVRGGAGGSRVHRFLVVNDVQVILVEPDTRVGWGVVKLAGFLQDIEVTGDKDDSKCLHVTIQKTNAGPLTQAKFIFDDHIRCMAAKQRLNRGRTQARLAKMQQIAKLLDLPSSVQPCPSPPLYTLRGFYFASLLDRYSGTRNHPPLASRSRPLFTRVPGYATPVQFSPRERSPQSGRTSSRSPHSGPVQFSPRERSPHSGRSSRSPSQGRTRSLGAQDETRPRSEEIPLSDIQARLNNFSNIASASNLDPTNSNSSFLSSSNTSNILGPGSNILVSGSSNILGNTSNILGTNSNILGTGSSLSRKSSGASSLGSCEDGPNPLPSSVGATAHNPHPPLSRKKKKNRGQIETV
ncbi:hypothetical protein M8J75_007909 [Diaphorina citri]|nr:hypothetical protein M8J75_007909 [Diaphorina citri]KAI5728990.1 hypothetical protein M8J77_023983 [Diaphorina citri]